MHASYLIVAGGTGGHLSPGTALAEHIFRAGHGVEFLSLEKNRDYPDLKSASYPVNFYNAPSLSRKGALLFPFLLLGAMIRSVPVVRRNQVIILMGGFPCLPAGLMAALLRRPIYLCEQNAVMGRANRFFSRFARNVFLTFPLTGRDHGPGWPVVGNPLRSSFLLRTGSMYKSGDSTESGKKSKKARASTSGPRIASGKSSVSSKKEKDPFPPGKGKKILVAGGSQGAVQINDMVLKLAQNQPRFFGKYRWVLQAGVRNESEMKEAFSGYRNMQVIGFDPDIHRFYESADILICRSGAGVLTEAFQFGLPLVLIPYPYATDSHQKENALYAKIAGAAKLIDTTESDHQALHSILAELDIGTLKQMQKISATLARPDASQRIMEEIEKDISSVH